MALRSSVVYCLLIVVFRLAGKRHVAQLSLIDFILILLVSNAVQNAMVGEDTTLGGGIAAALTLVAINVILTKLTVNNKAINKIVEGEPKLLLRDGNILKNVLSKENLTIQELEESVRKAGHTSISEVALAILETDGSISIIGKDKLSSKN
ncbi:MAG TPA: YetF domain-containing protein [Candidatus Kapabacteria bacterium]